MCDLEAGRLGHRRVDACDGTCRRGGLCDVLRRPWRIPREPAGGRRSRPPRSRRHYGAGLRDHHRRGARLRQPRPHGDTSHDRRARGSVRPVVDRGGNAGFPGCVGQAHSSTSTLRHRSRSTGHSGRHDGLGAPHLGSFPGSVTAVAVGFRHLSRPVSSHGRRPVEGKGNGHHAFASPFRTRARHRRCSHHSRSVAAPRRGI